jgi:3-hydroxyacyl-CoA dehydrogenase
MPEPEVVTLEVSEGIGLFTIDNPPVNGVSQAVRSGLVRCLDAAAAERDLAALVIVCAGPCFLSGLDVREFGKAPQGPDQRELLAALDAFEAPVVGVAHGVALGAGLETLLCCDYRAVQTGTELALQEVRYGLLPGAGGTQRLTRLIGVVPALEMMVGGGRVGADRARELGLVDEVFGRDIAPGVAGRAAARRWLDAGRGKRRVREMTVCLDPAAEQALAEVEGGTAARARGFRTPARIAACVRAAAGTFAAGMAVEAREHAACEADPQCRAMLHVFFAERRHRVLTPDVAHLAEGLRRAAICGAGAMGRSLARACLAAGLDVCLTDRDLAAARRGVEAVTLMVEDDVAHRRITAARGARECGRIRLCETAALPAADVVVEAVYEDFTLKRDLLKRLDRAHQDARLLAINTSTLSVSSLAAAVARPERVLALHFFGPADAAPVVEIAVGARTSGDAVDTARAFLQRLGKCGIVTGDGFGFVGDRMRHTCERENQLMLLEGATPAAVDAAMTAFGMAAGPNEAADTEGLDVAFRSRRAWAAAPVDERYYRVSEALVQAGRLGRGVGRGVFRYEADSARPLPDPDVDDIIRREARALGIARRSIDASEIVERCTLALIVEGVRLLEAGIARRAADIDAIWCGAFGFPRHRGGPMYYADSLGLDHVTDRLRHLARRYGEAAWGTPPLLEATARAGRSLARLEAPLPA